MSIASPRPSLNLPSSRRTSTSTITSTRSPSSSRPASIRDSTNTTATSTPVPTSARRRDRAALREFYNLQSSQADASTAKPPPASTTQQEDTATPDALAALDSATFDAKGYVHDLLSTSDAETLLRTLNSITISSLGLEGDKKALVYDNYTTLLSATSTISKMRENVDPMAPVTTTLEPAVGHIVDVAVGISDSRKGGRDGGERDKEVVRWVLGAPERLRASREDGKIEEMRREWEEVKRLLGSWEGVKGVEDVRRKCEEVVGKD